MKQIFMDTNVVIDFLADRQPFSLDAAKLFNMSIEGRIKIHISAVSYNNIYYVLRQSLTNNATIKLLENLADITDIADVSNQVIRQSLKADFKDYEDAIQYYSALTVPNIDFIVTRNTKDFKKSSLSVLTPTEAIALLSSEV
ncbi:MAG: PIN domain-containing protein [Flavobacterium sp.]|uniref:type II toxin-antitoxin system VapC family toxin n=1 Tax=Pedobacter agri TaxID=454586 RepID=UPI00120AF1AB|nr:PIN domain-containing protein [Pedobacter agri]RZJ48281.1 MAG: PIN domain-containing protein [Flavobacterium sp.]